MDCLFGGVCFFGLLDRDSILNSAAAMCLQVCGYRQSHVPAISESS